MTHQAGLGGAAQFHQQVVQADAVFLQILGQLIGYALQLLALAACVQHGAVVLDFIAGYVLADAHAALKQGDHLTVDFVQFDA